MSLASLYATTVAGGSFNGPSSFGYVQGASMPDSVSRTTLQTAFLASSESLPMWPGVGLYADVAGAAGALIALGSAVGRATGLTTSKPLLGFSAIDNNDAALTTPQSPVPTSGPGGPVTWYPLGSRTRLQLACDPALAALAAEGSVINTPISWDFPNSMLTPYMGSTAISSGTYVGGTGIVTLVVVGNTLNPGDTVVISGATGTGSFAAINGTFTLLAGTNATTLVYAIATGLTLTITGANFASQGILPVQLLSVQSGNSMTVVYNSITGNATWNRQGSAAVVRL